MNETCLNRTDDIKLSIEQPCVSPTSISSAEIIASNFSGHLYHNQYVVPLFCTLLALEHFVLRLQGKQGILLNDGIISLAHCIMQQATEIVWKALLMTLYYWLYQWRFTTMDWDSASSWLLLALVCDLAYYWLHRFCHEVNIAWSFHQVHHSSEEYNLTVSIRQSAFQNLFAAPFFASVALLGAPPTLFLIHLHLNLIYQLLVHTTAIGFLGPLELIFVTPSHHRVHHGVNRFCLDKNYGGWLIIWDRIFGTFESEKSDVEIVYGIVGQPNTLSPIYQQIFYLGWPLKKATEAKSWSNFLKGIFYGPSWFPGTTRLGELKDKADIRAPRVKYSPRLSLLLEIYILVHTILLAAAIGEFPYLTIRNITTIIVHSGYMVATMIMIGAFFDKLWWAKEFEAIRCGTMTIYSSLIPVFHFIPILNSILPSLFALSTLLWLSRANKRLIIGSKIE